MNNFNQLSTNIIPIDTMICRKIDLNNNDVDSAIQYPDVNNYIDLVFNNDFIIPEDGFIVYNGQSTNNARNNYILLESTLCSSCSDKGNYKINTYLLVFKGDVLKSSTYGSNTFNIFRYYLVKK